MSRTSARAVDLSHVVWPRSIEVLGDMRGGCPLAHCIACEPNAHPAVAMTNVQYGGHPLCLEHARSLASGAHLEFVSEALERAIAGPKDAQQ